MSDAELIEWAEIERGQVEMEGVMVEWDDEPETEETAETN